MIDKLTKEISKRIILDVGAGVPKLFGRAGITESHLLTNKTVKASYDDGHQAIHKVFAGKISLSPPMLGMLIDLSLDIPEYLLIIKTLDQKFVAIKAVFNEDEGEEFFIRSFYVPDGAWKHTGMFQKAYLLGLFEEIVQAGHSWESIDTNEANELYNVAIKLIGGE